MVLFFHLFIAPFNLVLTSCGLYSSCISQIKNYIFIKESDDQYKEKENQERGRVLWDAGYSDAVRTEELGSPCINVWGWTHSERKGRDHYIITAIKRMNLQNQVECSHS